MTASASPSFPPTPRSFFWAVTGLCLLALVPTVWPGVDIWMASQFSGPDAALPQVVQWPWVVWINAWIPAAFRVLLLIALMGLGLTWAVPKVRHWRFALAFFVLAGALGPGVLVNLGFKDNWQRARPYQVTEFGGTQQFTRAAVMTDQCDANCSFVSGHVACGFFIASLALLHRRRALRWTAAGLLAGGLIGFSRMSDSAHWFSDVLWAGPITMVCSWLVWRAMLWFQHRYPPQQQTPAPGEST